MIHNCVVDVDACIQHRSRVTEMLLGNRHAPSYIHLPSGINDELSFEMPIDYCSEAAAVVTHSFNFN